MRNFLRQIWTEQDGVLTFEWVLLLTVLVVGIVGGIAAVRDAVISELGDVSQGVTRFDQSFVIPGNKTFNIRRVKFRDDPLPIEIVRGKKSPGQGTAIDND